MRGPHLWPPAPPGPGRHADYPAEAAVEGRKITKARLESDRGDRVGCAAESRRGEPQALGEEELIGRHTGHRAERSEKMVGADRGIARKPREVTGCSGSASIWRMTLVIRSSWRGLGGISVPPPCAITAAPAIHSAISSKFKIVVCRLGSRNQRQQSLRRRHPWHHEGGAPSARGGSDDLLEIDRVERKRQTTITDPMLVTAFEMGSRIAKQERTWREGRPPLSGPVLESAPRDGGHADRFVPLLEWAVLRTGGAHDVQDPPTWAGRQQRRAQ